MIYTNITYKIGEANTDNASLFSTSLLASSDSKTAIGISSLCKTWQQHVMIFPNLNKLE